MKKSKGRCHGVCLSEANSLNIVAAASKSKGCRLPAVNSPSQIAKRLKQDVLFDRAVRRSAQMRRFQTLHKSWADCQRSTALALEGDALSKTHVRPYHEIYSDPNFVQVAHHHDQNQKDAGPKQSHHTQTKSAGKRKGRAHHRAAASHSLERLNERLHAERRLTTHLDEPSEDQQR